MRHRPGEKRDSGELADFHKSPPPHSRTVHKNEEETKQRRQEVCLDEQVAPNLTQT